jgi:hypothetical protein
MPCERGREREGGASPPVRLSGAFLPLISYSRALFNFVVCPVYISPHPGVIGLCLHTGWSSPFVYIRTRIRTCDLTPSPTTGVRALLTLLSYHANACRRLLLLLLQMALQSMILHRWGHVHGCGRGAGIAHREVHEGTRRRCKLIWAVVTRSPLPGWGLKSWI